jgi:alpha-tubulin suppressor-like RCC1 family protein
VYAFGRGSEGCLGTGTRIPFSSIPLKINALRHEIIKRVACGYNHCLAVAGLFQNTNDFILIRNIINNWKSSSFLQKVELFINGDNFISLQMMERKGKFGSVDG